MHAAVPGGGGGAIDHTGTTFNQYWDLIFNMCTNVYSTVKVESKPWFILAAV